MALEQALKYAGLQDDTSWANGGLHSPAEIVADIVQPYGLESEVEELLRKAVVPFVHKNRAFELLHCFFVADKGARLVQQVSEDKIAQQKLGVHEVDDRHVNAAFIAGLQHDISLAFTQQKLSEATPLDGLKALVHIDDHYQIKNPQYMRDRIDDDLRGVYLLDKYSTTLKPEVKSLAKQELLSSVGLKILSESKNILGYVSAHAAADGACHHGMNAILRGHAEAPALVGDLMDLHQRGLVKEETVFASVTDWLIPYTTIPENWESREYCVDAVFLRSKINRKTGDLLDLVQKTPTYDWILSGGLTDKNMVGRVLKTPAFWRAADEGIELVRRFAKMFPHYDQLDTLQRNFAAIELYRGN